MAGLVVDELNKLGTTPVEDAELGPRKAVLIGGFGQQLETNSGIVDRIGTLALYGLGLAEINPYTSVVQSTTPADIQTFAAAHPGGT